MTTLADLTGHHLGLEVEFTDGGATYRGVLAGVNHRTNWKYEPDTIQLELTGDNGWRHVGHHERDLRVEIADQEVSGL